MSNLLEILLVCCLLGEHRRRRIATWIASRFHSVVILREGASTTEESLFDSPEIFQVCHSERSEESLWATSDSDRDVSGIRPQHDKLCALIGNRLSYPQGKLFCHSERSEESLLSTRDFLSKTLKSTTSDSDRDSSGFTSPKT